MADMTRVEQVARLAELRGRVQSDLTEAEREERDALATTLAGTPSPVMPGQPVVPPVAKPLTETEEARLAALRALPPNPEAGPKTRTPEEEVELKRLADAEAAAKEAAAAPRPVPTDRERLAALKSMTPHPASVPRVATVRSEGEEIEFRRLTEKVAREDRLDELRKMATRNPEQAAEMAALVADGVGERRVA